METEILQQILTELKGIKSDVSELKSDVRELKQGQAKLEQGQADLKKELKKSTAFILDEIERRIDHDSWSKKQKAY